MLAGGNSMVFARTSRARLSPVALLVAALALASAPAAAQGVADFYRGRTINFVVGFGPGGGCDLYAPVISRRICRHIPFNPLWVEQNMDDAGSARASHYV